MSDQSQASRIEISTDDFLQQAYDDHFNRVIGGFEGIFEATLSKNK